MRTPKNRGLSSPANTSVSNSENHRSYWSHYSLYRRVLFSGIMLLLAMSLTQCSKEDGPDPTQTPTGIAISGIVQAPTGTTAKSDASGPAGITAKSETSAGETPLPNTKVELYRVSDYFSNPATAQPLATVTTGAAGRFTAQGIPPNTDILAITQSDPRLSAIYLNVSIQTNIDINTATTLTAEYLAPYLHAGQSLTNQRLQSVLLRAADITVALSGNELLAILNGLLPDKFGQGLPDNPPPQFQYILDELSGIQQIDCSGITFSLAQGKPATVVEVVGLLPEMGDEPLLWVSSTSKVTGLTEGKHLAYFERTEGDMAVFVVPLHPTMLMEGGEVLLTLTSEDGTLACAPRPFTIQSLDEVQGVFEEMVDQLEASLYHLSDLLGADPEALLVADVKTLEPSMAALATGLKGVKGPDNPYSLRAMLSGDATIDGEPIFDGPAKAIAEAMMVSSGLADVFQDISSNTLGIQVEQIENESGRLAKTNKDQLSLEPISLHRLMEVQDNYSRLNGPLLKASKEAFGIMMGGIAVGAAAVGAAPIAGTAGIAGTAVAIHQLAVNMMIDLLPSKLDGFLMEVDPAVFDEDDPDPGQWEAKLVASNKGFTFDWPTAIGLIPGWGKLGGGVAWVTRGSTAFKQGVEIGFQVSLDAARSVFGIVEGSNMNLNPNEFVVTVDPNRNQESNFFEWEMRTITTEKGGDPIVLDGGNALIYHNREVGTAEIRIRTTGNYFQGQVVNNNRQLGVAPIIIEVLELDGGALFAPPVYMEVDEEAMLQANVENALDEDVTWRVIPDNTGLVIHPKADNQVLIVSHEPGEYVVVAESASRMGPRAANNPVRWGSARVIVDGLRLNNPNCLTKGESFQFVARFGNEPIEFSELNWTINGPGSISGSGVYSSNQEGDVKVEFSLKRNPLTTETVEFQVRQKCPNQYRVQIAGGPLAGIYAGEIEHDDDDYMVIPFHINQETDFGITGLTTAMLNLVGPNINVGLNILMDAGVPRPVGAETGDSFVQLVVADRLMVGVQGQITLSDYRTYFDLAGNESAWSGTVEFSGMFGFAAEEDSPLFPASGRIVVMPFPADED
jgi:hypothetical protein